MTRRAFGSLTDNSPSADDFLLLVSTSFVEGQHLVLGRAGRGSLEMVLEVGVRPGPLGEAQVGWVPNHGPLSLQPRPVVGRHREVGRLSRYLDRNRDSGRDDACVDRQPSIHHRFRASICLIKQKDALCTEVHPPAFPS